jgi:AmmeMemoRadiSam system protein A
MPSDPLGQALLTIARNAVAGKLDLPKTPAPAAQPEFQQPAATFVTLTIDGQLRGCIGRLQASRPLAEDVAANAIAAAFDDPRFPPLRREEFAAVRFEVSLLSPAEDFPVRDEADACARLRPGIDGVILSHGCRHATFLPQVWESLPKPERFLAELKRKAGLSADFWSPDLLLLRYEVKKWQEN